MQDKNSTRCYYKNETEIEQDYNKNMYPKLVLNILKVMGILLLFIHTRHLTQGSFSNFQSTCGLSMPHVWILSESKFN
jgi:hypothetical protein